MKSVIAFVAGCFTGSIVTLICLRKEIKTRITAIQTEAMEAALSKDKDSKDDSEKDDDELPFTVGEGGEVKEDVRVRTSGNSINTSKVKYDALVRKTMSSEDIDDEEDEGEDEADDPQDAFYEELKGRPQFEPIHDMGDFNDPNFDTETYVFFRGDGVFCTDEGTIVERPALLVGTEWMNWIGEVKPRTALVRDNKRIKSIDITVEDGLYSDEYGDYIKED